jgi:TolA-binding protein
MKHTLTTLAIGLALLGAFSASPAAADKETRQMMADIRILQEQAQESANTLGALTSALNEAIKALNARLDQQTEATRKALADQKATIDAQSADLRAIRERMDDNSVRLGQVTQEVDALRQTMLRMGTSAPPPQEFSSGAGSVAPPAGGGLPGGGMSPTAAFHQAEGDFFSGQYEVAVTELQQYIKDFPNSEFADDAQVLIGTSFLNQPGKNQQAVDAYDLAIRTYPKSDKLAEAYYRKAMALSNLKRYEEARDAADYVIKTYPDSSEATLAKQLLARIAPASPPAKR